LDSEAAIVAEKKPSRGGEALVMLVILVRVGIILALWLGVFLATFLGYFTVPVILIGLVIAIYMLSDLGLFLVIRRRRRKVDKRREFLDSFKD
jgi:apolipoprotein N-acyltransferase